MGSMGSSVAPLPSADASNLILVQPTPSERIECIRINGEAWRGPLNPDQYIQRENYLREQELAKDGGLTLWILVEDNQPADNRVILSACETLRKPAFLAHNGTVEDILTQGIGSVYCRPEFRKRGYAKRMLEELMKRVDTWQQEDEKRKKCVFSVLYSDIGKNFYAQFGWKPFQASHIAFPPLSRDGSNGNGPAGVKLPMAKDMTAESVKRSMCSMAVINRHRDILRTSSVGSSAKVAVVPDSTHLDWHWAREDFHASKLWPTGSPPSVKGASVDSQKVYCTWTRTFGYVPENNTLHILRLLNDEPTTPSEEQSTVEAIAAVLRRAQYEAHKWEMRSVEIWNPTPLVKRAARILDPNAEVVDRERSSIPCLKWEGAEQGLGDDVEWYWNEKYSWC